MKKIIILALALTLLGGCTNTFSSKKTVSLNENWKESTAPYSDSVVCTLQASATADFEKDHISMASNIDEKPMTLTFVDIDSDSPSMVGNLGDKEPLLKIDNGKRVYFVEKTGFGNINIFTLFRDKNIMIMSKQYELVEPFGLLMMGDCLSGV